MADHRGDLSAALRNTNGGQTTPGSWYRRRRAMAFKGRDDPLRRWSLDCPHRGDCSPPYLQLESVLHGISRLSRVLSWSKELRLRKSNSRQPEGGRDETLRGDSCGSSTLRVEISGIVDVGWRRFPACCGDRHRHEYDIFTLVLDSATHSYCDPDLTTLLCRCPARLVTGFLPLIYVNLLRFLPLVCSLISSPLDISVWE